MASLTEQEAAQYRRGVKDGREYTLRLVRQLAEKEKLLDHNNRDYMKGWNAALADLLNHLKSIVVI